jgi:hypothetical protein
VESRIDREGSGTPVPPIFVVDRDGGDVSTFDDARAIGGVCEPPEVQADAYLVFDSLGHQATLAVTGRDTTIQSWSAEPAPEQLREYLARFVLGLGHSVDDEHDLPGLVRMAAELARGAQDRRTHPRFAVHFAAWLRRRRKR